MMLFFFYSLIKSEKATKNIILWKSFERSESEQNAFPPCLRLGRLISWCNEYSNRRGLTLHTLNVANNPSKLEKASKIKDIFRKQLLRRKAKLEKRKQIGENKERKKAKLNMENTIKKTILTKESKTGEGLVDCVV